MGRYESKDTSKFFLNSWIMKCNPNVYLEMYTLFAEEYLLITYWIAIPEAILNNKSQISVEYSESRSLVDYGIPWSYHRLWNPEVLDTHSNPPPSPPTLSTHHWLIDHIRSEIFNFNGTDSRKFAAAALITETDSSYS